ncbi:MAG TPA: LamG-like jellyroll fold domain-containing protein [Verrucomicrobiae bacterium]|jgi:autotransporter-associated beta strand protein|nr:LamG-like jellyroll fold domain-containing protein [Verrucomicrobiae bacterium]
MKKTNSTLLTCKKLFALLALALIFVFAARADYQSTVLADNPLAFYAVNPGVNSANSEPDLTTNGNVGYSINVYPANGPSIYITNAGIFDGQDSEIDLSLIATNPALLNFSGPITLEAWAQPANSSEGPADILAKGFDQSQSADEITIRANGGNYFAGTYGSNGTRGASGGHQDTNWVYIVGVNDGTNWFFYVNGFPTQTNADNVGSINFTDAWRIGNGSADGNGRYFSGNLTEVALYNYALTPAQVLNHFFIGEVNTAPVSSVPVIVGQPQSQSTFTGGSVTFNVNAVSALPATYQWYRETTLLSGKTNASVTISGVSSADAVNYHVVVSNSNGSTNSASASLTLLAAGNSLRWTGSSSSTWDTGSSPNWINTANGQTVTFNTNDQVLFDDTPGVPQTVSVGSAVAPSVFTVDTTTNSFLFNGSGPITGSGSLIKKGTSLLTLNVSANFTGTVNISGGTVYAGNFAFQSVAAMTVTNGGTLDFAGGPLSTGQPLTVGGVGVGKGGALINTSYELYDQVFNMTLVGDTTFGGTSRWDLGDGSSISGPYKITINRASGVYGEWDTVNLSTNVGNIEITSGKLGVKGMGNTFGNPNNTLTVDGGCELDFYDSNFGANSGYNKNIHVLSSGLIQMLSSPSILFNANVTLESGANWNFFSGSGGVTNGGVWTLNGPTHLQVGDTTITFTNVIGGAGGFVWDNYNNELVFTAANTYAGPTVLGGGRMLGLIGNGSISHSTPIFFGGSTVANVEIDASGRSDGTLTLTSGQVLGGIGTVNGNLVVGSGATIEPAGTNSTLGISVGANPIGTIAASGSVQLNGTTTLKLNGTGVNDSIQAGSSIAFNGILNLINISGAPYAVNQTFQIATASSYSGDFSQIVPNTPGSGLVWDKSQLNNGILGIIAGSAPIALANPQVVGTNLVFGGSGGPASGSYVVLTSTNAAVPVSTWTPIATNSFTAGGTFSVTNGIVTGAAGHYYAIKILP